MMLKLAHKMSAYDLKISQKDTFPLEVFESQFLRRSLDSFELRGHIRKHYKKLIHF